MNEKEINANELYELLESISEYIEIEVQMYALVGTALTILGVKQSTRDIDININSSKQYNYIREIFEKIGFKNNRSLRWFTQEGLAFDLFHAMYMPGVETSNALIESIRRHTCISIQLSRPGLDEYNLQQIAGIDSINLYT